MRRLVSCMGCAICARRVIDVPNTMKLLRIDDISEGMVAARPARNDAGMILLAAGTSLGPDQLRGLSRVGIQELWVVAAGEAVPDPTVPEYMDRYGSDFPTRLQKVFAGSLQNSAMQRLFLGALTHAADCYRRYRIDTDSKDVT